MFQSGFEFLHKTKPRSGEIQNTQDALSMVVQAHNSSTQETEARILWFEANLGYIIDFKASLDYNIKM